MQKATTDECMPPSRKGCNTHKVFPMKEDSNYIENSSIRQLSLGSGGFDSLRRRGCGAEKTISFSNWATSSYHAENEDEEFFFFFVEFIAIDGERRGWKESSFHDTFELSFFLFFVVVALLKK
jgi:hypothetical protein